MTLFSLQENVECKINIIISDTFYLAFFSQSEPLVQTSMIVSSMPNMGPTIRPPLSLHQTSPSNHHIYIFAL